MPPSNLPRTVPQRTSSAVPDAPALAPSPGGDGGRLLADAISLNALLSGASGLLLVSAGFALGPRFGVDPWILLAVGIGLVGFAGLLLWLLTQPGRLVAGTRWVVAADAAWIVAATTLLIGFPSALSSLGRTTLAALTALVASLALAQLTGLRRAGRSEITGSSPLTLQVRRVIPAPAERVWDAVADAGNYARFAPGIADTAIIDGEQEGMVRVCTDDRGGRWSETCTLWDEGHRYRMTVDVSSYPAYYRALLHRFTQTWTVEAAPNGTRLTLTFDGLVKLGIVGRLVARLLGNPRRLEAIFDAYEHEMTANSHETER